MAGWGGAQVRSGLQDRAGAQLAAVQSIDLTGGDDEEEDTQTALPGGAGGDGEGLLEDPTKKLLSFQIEASQVCCAFSAITVLASCMQQSSCMQQPMQAPQSMTNSIASVQVHGHKPSDFELLRCCLFVGAQQTSWYTGITSWSLVC